MLLSGKKCAGILLEAAPAEGKINAAVVGIGINVHQGSVPESLATEAACLDEMAHTLVPRRQLLVQFLQHFQRWYLLFEKGNHVELLERWKSRPPCGMGSGFGFAKGTGASPAVTCGLNEIGALLVRTGGRHAGNHPCRRHQCGHGFEFKEFLICAVERRVHAFQTILKGDT